MRKIFALTLAAIMIAMTALVVAPVEAQATTTVQSAAHDYSHPWVNDNTGRLIETFYRAHWDPNLAGGRWRHTIHWEISVSGNTIFRNQTNTQVANNLRGAQRRYFGFYDGNTFMFINTNGALISINRSDWAATTLVASGVTELRRNRFDLLTSAVVNGTQVNIVDIISTPPGGEEGTVDRTSGDFVTRSRDSQGRFVLEAFRRNNSTMVIHLTDSGRVVNVTANVILTEHCKGARFLGIDDLYGVWLYDEARLELLRFVHGSWNNPQRISLTGELLGITNARDGFMNGVEVWRNNQRVEVSIGDLLR
jgi:hypothetical protein